MNGKYILEGHKPVIENDLIKWAKWFEKADRIVAKTQIGDIRVSTVFLGLDHSFGHNKPLLFETLCFVCNPVSGNMDGKQERYSTWDEAKKGHELMVEKVKKEAEKG